MEQKFGGPGDESPPVRFRGEAPVGGLGAKTPEADDFMVIMGSLITGQM